MLKRCLSLFLALLLICITFSACGNGQANTAKLPENIMQKSDPAKDNELNILMIGNSHCYYYTEELYGMLTAAGYQNVNVCNVYYSGCTLQQHYSWQKSGTANYEYFTTNGTGQISVKSVNLEYCLKQRNWDVISLQESNVPIREFGVQKQLKLSKNFLMDLWGYIKEQYPLSRYLWQQTLSLQIGYSAGGYKVETPEQQKAEAQLIKEYSLAVCEDYNLERVPTGDAWQIVREGGYDNLCARLGINNGEGDYIHEGDIGGGQYLSACVWFEVITGKSCVGNTYIPNYAMFPEQATLQAAAHKAVSLMIN
ncbi:MAG: DUF4886 domain-containing protein [Oscillospiraceae bacterium]|nr:DUF4886 domain-containing protein [Oscillospiraceae bacterium]